MTRPSMSGRACCSWATTVRSSTDHPRPATASPARASCGSEPDEQLPGGDRSPSPPQPCACPGGPGWRRRGSRPGIRGEHRQRGPDAARPAAEVLLHEQRHGDLVGERGRRDCGEHSERQAQCRGAPHVGQPVADLARRAGRARALPIRSVASTATSTKNDSALIPNATAAPNAGTSSPPSAAPSVIPSSIIVPLSAAAAGAAAGGTSCGVSARRAGVSTRVDDAPERGQHADHRQGQPVGGRGDRVARRRRARARPRPPSAASAGRTGRRARRTTARAPASGANCSATTQPSAPGSSATTTADSATTCAHEHVIEGSWPAA